MGLGRHVGHAGEHVHCNTTLHSTQMLDKKKGYDGSQQGGTSLGRRKTRADFAACREMFDPFFTTVYVDDYLY